MRLLGLHGFRTNAKVLETQLKISRFSQEVPELEVECLNAPHLARGPSAVEDTFEGPFFEWWNSNKIQDGSFLYEGWETTLEYVQDYMLQNGPFSGLLGFSQGAALAAILVALQQRGELLQKVPSLELCVLVAGFPARNGFEFGQQIMCRSVHLLGSGDALLEGSETLSALFKDPTVIVHDGGHVVPKLQGSQLDALRSAVQCPRRGSESASKSEGVQR